MRHDYRLLRGALTATSLPNTSLRFVLLLLLYRPGKMRPTETKKLSKTSELDFKPLPSLVPGLIFAGFFVDLTAEINIKSQWGLKQTGE